MKMHSFSSFILVSSLCACVSVNCFLLPTVLLPHGLLPSKKRGASPTCSVGAAGGDLRPPTDIFIFGLGYTGLAVARAAKQEWGDVCRIAGTCRSQHKANALRKIGIEAFPFDIDGDYEPLKGRALEILQRRYSICRPWESTCSAGAATTQLTAQKSLQHTYPQHHAADCRLQPRPRARVSPVFSMLSMSTQKPKHSCMCSHITAFMHVLAYHCIHACARISLSL